MSDKRLINRYDNIGGYNIGACIYRVDIILVAIMCGVLTGAELAKLL